MLTQTQFQMGDRVLIKSFPGDSKGFTGKVGRVTKIDPSSRITELLLELEDGSGNPWVSEKWVELIEDEQTQEEESGLEFWEGDRVRGEHIVNGSSIEGIVKSVGKKYLKLTSGDAIHKATAEMLESGAEPSDRPEPEEDRKLKKGDRVTHQTIPGFGVVKKLLRRGKVSVYFEGDGITSSVPAETLTLIEDEPQEDEGPDLKVGDRVWYGERANTGIITDLQYPDVEVKFDHGQTVTISYRWLHSVVNEPDANDESERPQGSGEGFTGEFGRSYEAEAQAIAASTPPVETVAAEIIPSDPGERLTQLEGEILEGMKLMEQGKTKVWQAVAAIRSENLWELNGHKSFKEYVQVRFGWKESYAHEIASAGETAAQLLGSGVPEESLPESAAAYRPLKNLAPEQASAALQKATEASKGKPTAKAVKAAVAEIQGTITPVLEPLPPIECKPSISPAEFNAEMRASRNAMTAGCHACQHRRLTGSGDRYWCAEDRFEDTLLLRDNWALMEGCNVLTPQVVEPQPSYYVPEGVGRLKPYPDGSCELFGLILTEQQQMRLAALSRTLDGSLLTAIKHLIDQLPEVILDE